MTSQRIPIDVVDLLPVLDKELMQLLHSLSPAEWEQQTVAKLWKVKDVVAHLLDGNIRILSMLRDGYFGVQPATDTPHGLLHFLNELNADWVQAMRRVSPAMLILLHEMTGPLYSNYYRSLDPWAKAGFAVDWAGESESRNWMHIAREYTEKWLHQQQIRDAVVRTGLLTREFYYPFIDIFMLALPHTFRNVVAAEGTVVKMTIGTELGGSWCLLRSDSTWQLSKDDKCLPAAEITIDPDTSWKLFSKSVHYEQVKDRVSIKGDNDLALVALSMVSVMA